MSILVIGLSLLLAHFGGALWRPTQRRVLNAYLSWTITGLGRFKWLAGGCGLLLAPVLPAILVGLGQHWLQANAQVLGSFVFSVFFVTLALGPRSLAGDVAQYLEADDEQARGAAAEALAFSYRHPVTGGGRDAVIKGVFYQGLVRWFGVIFWFLVLGPAGALMFRLAHQLLCEPPNRSLLGPLQVIASKRLVAILDLLPAAGATFALAIVGDFDTVIQTWRHHFVTDHRSAFSWDYEYLPEVGFRTVMRGDELEDAFSHEYDGALAKVSLAMSLMYRTLICWLTVIAMLVIANWVH